MDDEIVESLQSQEDETLMDFSEQAPQNDGEDVDNPSASPSFYSGSAAPLTGSETLEDDLPLCEERVTACGGEVDEQNTEYSPDNIQKSEFAVQKFSSRSSLMKSPELQNEEKPNIKITEVYRL